MLFDTFVFQNDNKYIMKNLILVLMFLVSALLVAQEKEEKDPQDINKKYEIKINALTLLALEWIDVSYERLIDEESSFGTAVTLNTDSDVSDLNYSITPYYRRYFSEKFARGFFLEGFGMLFSAEDDSFFDTNNGDVTGLALGISVGGKFVSKDGFTAELLLGVGRNFLESQNNEAVGRFGISVGYRF
jgi:hypothetical protein